MAARIRSIAVLPLENLSHDPEQDHYTQNPVLVSIDRWGLWFTSRR